MADIDATILNTEFNIYALLMFQGVLLLVAGLVGYRRRKGSNKFFASSIVLLGLSVTFCAFAFYHCWEFETYIRGRLSGLIAGPLLDQDRAERYLAEALVCRWVSGTIFVVALVVAFLFNPVPYKYRDQATV